MSINTNVNALGAIRRLAEASYERSRTLERLSSGLRINQASDDAAGLSVASALNVKARVHTQALRNVNDGIGYLNVADGATGELKTVLMRLRELSTQASSGSLSNTQRQSLDKEVQALQGEYNRIIDTTKFNGVSVFGGDALHVQAGYGVEGALGVTLASYSSVTKGDGTFQGGQPMNFLGNPYAVSVADMDGDGKFDLVAATWYGNTVQVFLGNGDGTFKAMQSSTAGTDIESISLADVNGDGVMDLVSADYGSNTLSVLLGNGDGTFQARRSIASGGNPSSVSLADVNGDGVIDLVSADSGINTLSVLIGNGDGTFKARRSFASGSFPSSVSLADVNGDGVMDLVSADTGNSTLSVLLGNGDGTFQSRRSFASVTGPRSAFAADVNGDGAIDLVSADYGSSTLSVLLGNGDGTFQVRRSVATGTTPYSVSMADFNGDGVLDLVSAEYYGNTLSVLIGNGDGTFKARHPVATGANPNSVSMADFNGDGVLDLVSADTNSFQLSIYLGNGSTTTTFQSLTRLSGVNVATQSDALSAQDQIDSYLDNVNTVSSAIGSAMSRFAYAAHLLESSVEVTKAAESRIRDVDVAEESSRLVSTDILQQAASAVLAHALKGPELALMLLKT